MGTLYERIQELCKAKGVSGSRMCLDLGLSKSTLSDLKYGRTKGMNAATAQKVAAYLDVSVEYLLGEDEKKEPSPVREELSDYDIRILNWFRSLPEDKRQAILLIGDAPKDLS